MTAPLLEVEVIVLGEGIELSLYPWEDPALVAAEIESVFAEVEAKPGLGWEPTPDELLEIFGEEVVNGEGFGVESFAGRQCPHCRATTTYKTANGYWQCASCGGIF